MSKLTHMTRRFPWLRVVVRLLPPLLAAGGCASPPDLGLADDNPSNRVRAIRRAEQTPEPATTALLVQQLVDDDPAVRFYAIGALKRMAGTDLGYRYYDGEIERNQAAERWQAWLKEQQQPGGTTRPAVVRGE
jgi:hypothetical protein